MNRRQFAVWILMSGVVIGKHVQGNALASVEPPTVEADSSECDLDLYFADLTVVLEIPIDVPTNQFQSIESSLIARLHALGWSSCSVDRSDRQILVNVQVPVDSEVDSVLVGELVTAAGRVDLVDSGDGYLEIGERITTSTHLSGPDSPEVNVVYQAILTNNDFVSVEGDISDTGVPKATIEITDAAAIRLGAFSSENIGSQMPIVIDGVVRLAPVIQGEIGSVFELQPLDLATIEMLTVYTSAAPYPAPLVVTSFHDNRATPIA